MCQPCNCDPVGSLNLQCDSYGQCICKTGVTGEKCNQCLPDFFNFDVIGCTSCDCNEAGSANNNPVCDTNTGRCECKVNVEGRRCDSCKTGYFNLQDDDPFGCMSCFCHGHSPDCTSAPGYEYANLQSKFSTGRYLLVNQTVKRKVRTSFSLKC